MSELKVHRFITTDELFTEANAGALYYDKSEADKVIAELEESHKMEVGQLLIEIAELKNRIAPKQSDKTLQERLNEVCEKHGVSTLQDLDWAFCESEKRHTNDCIESAKAIARQKYKLCLAMAQEWRNHAAFCGMQSSCHNHRGFGKTAERYNWKECHAWKCVKRWLAIAKKFKEAK